MQFGFILSVLMHAMLIGLALGSFAATPPLTPKLPDSPPIIADVISASELDRMRKGAREAKLDVAAPKEVEKPDEAEKDAKRPTPVTAAAPPPPEAPPEPEKPIEVANAEPPPPPPKAAEPVKPPPDKAALDQKLEELALQKAEEEKVKKEAEAKAQAQAEAKAKAEAEAKAKADAEAKAEAQRKAAEKKKQELAEKLKREREAKKKKELAEKKKREREAKKKLDTNRLAALLDKTPDPKQAAAANPNVDPNSKAKGPVRGAAEGRDQTISASEASFLAGLMRQAVSRCWNINAGLDGIQNMVVKIDVKLTQSGEISGQPRVVNPQASPVFRDAADSAMRALLQCQPYTLPPDKYAGGWEHMIVTFDPARMF